MNTFLQGPQLLFCVESSFQTLLPLFSSSGAACQPLFSGRWARLVSGHPSRAVTGWTPSFVPSCFMLTTCLPDIIIPTLQNRKAEARSLSQVTKRQEKLGPKPVPSDCRPRPLVLQPLLPEYLASGRAASGRGLELAALKTGTEELPSPGPSCCHFFTHSVRVENSLGTQRPSGLPGP